MEGPGQEIIRCLLEPLEGRIAILVKIYGFDQGIDGCWEVWWYRCGCLDQPRSGNKDKSRLG